MSVNCFFFVKDIWVLMPEIGWILLNYFNTLENSTTQWISICIIIITDRENFSPKSIQHSSNFNFEDVVLIIISWTFNLFYKYLKWENSAREKSKNCKEFLLFSPFFKTKLTLPVYIDACAFTMSYKDRIVLLLLLFILK